MRVFLAGLLCAILSAVTLGQVPFERIVNADKEPGNWLTYSRDLLGHRYSPLNEITAENVANLKVKWAFQFPNERSEVSPIVVDGIMYVTSINECYALDAGSGRQVWHFRRNKTDGLTGNATAGINRGVAVAGDRVFMVADNAHRHRLCARNRCARKRCR